MGEVAYSRAVYEVIEEDGTKRFVYLLDEIWNVIQALGEKVYPIFEEEKVEELYGEILMAGKIAKKTGKGYKYPMIGHMVGLEGKIQGERKKLLAMAGF